MRDLLVVWRLFLVGVLIGGAVVLWRTGDALLRLLRPAGRSAWRIACMQSWARWMLAAIGARVRRDGAPPSEPVIFVSNHLSDVDILVLLSELPCVFVAKIEVSRMPVIGSAAADVGTIFIDREDFTEVARVNTRIEKALAEGLSVVIFPEATKSMGVDLLPFHPPLLAAAARSGRQVWYGALHYSSPVGSPPASEAIVWSKELPTRLHLQRLLQLPHFTARIRYGRAPIGGTDRKVLTRELRAAVHALFEPVRQ